MEAQVADLSDAIAYHAHDIDDGLRSGLLDWRALAELPLWRRALRQGGCDPGAPPPAARQPVTVALIDALATDLISNSAARLDAAGPGSAEDVRRLPEAPVALTPGLEAERREVARFLQKNFYRHPSVLRLSSEAERVLGDLWRAYADAPDGRLPGALEPAPGEPRERAIADYLAGMTDRYALDEHRKLSASRATA